jgi:hypothetical protein
MRTKVFLPLAIVSAAGMLAAAPVAAQESKSASATTAAVEIMASSSDFENPITRLSAGYRNGRLDLSTFTDIFRQDCQDGGHAGAYFGKVYARMKLAGPLSMQAELNHRSDRSYKYKFGAKLDIPTPSYANANIRLMPLVFSRDGRHRETVIEAAAGAQYQDMFINSWIDIRIGYDGTRDIASETTVGANLDRHVAIEAQFAQNHYTPRWAPGPRWTTRMGARYKF